MYSLLLDQQINYAADATTEARKVAHNLMQGHGGDLGSRARLQHIIMEMTRNIRDLYLAHAEAEGRPAILPDLERKEGRMKIRSGCAISTQPFRSSTVWL
jgi:hypothetical protein